MHSPDSPPLLFTLGLLYLLFSTSGLHAMSPVGWGCVYFCHWQKILPIDEDSPVVEDPAPHHREIAFFVVRMEKAFYCQFQTLSG